MLYFIAIEDVRAGIECFNSMLVLNRLADC